MILLLYNTSQFISLLVHIVLVLILVGCLDCKSTANTRIRFLPDKITQVFSSGGASVKELIVHKLKVVHNICEIIALQTLA